MNLTKHSVTQFCHVKDLGKLLKSGRFVRTTPVSSESDYYEVISKKKSQLDTIPVQASKNWTINYFSSF